MSDNPQMSPARPPKSHQPPSDQPTSERQAYNIVTDTILGPNVRWKDNLFQAIVIIGCLVVGSFIGLIWRIREIG